VIPARIISIDDNQIKNWEELSNVIISNPNKSMNLKIKRDGEIMEIKFATEASLQTGGGVAGFLPPMSPIVGGLNKGFPADVAGLQIGDTIISVAGIKINHWIELQQAIQGSKGEGQQIFIKRGSETFDVNMKPQWSDDIKAYVIGISPIQETITRRYGPIGALIEGTKKMGELTIMTFVVIKKLFFGEISIKTLGGPLMIAQVAGQAAETGLTAFLSLMAFLSLQLGILNLLPIPVLDGGYLVFFGIEAMRGKPLSEKVIMVAQQIGIALLVLLMVFVTYNDILRLDIIGFVRGLVE